MVTVKARCTCGPHQLFQATEIERRDLGAYDVNAGICHTDLHYAHDDKGRTVFPLVPGHEIAGIVSAVGAG
jgi:alcohol dehydrogenase (NADP+)